MLPAEHILDFYCVQLSNAAPFYENFTKLYFDPKHLGKDWKRRGGGGGGEGGGGGKISNAALNF